MLKPVLHLFQIATAIMQKIVYDEFLPSFLSDTAMEKYGLRSSASYSYDSDLDPTIINGFGIAFRYEVLQQWRIVM